VPLLYRVAAINVALLLVAVGLTVVILVPGHEPTYRVDEEVGVVVVAVALVVLLNLVLLRRVVRPLQRLTALARTVDLTDPRPPVPDAEPSSEAGELALTFNEMLARLREERRDATGRVLAGQEAERLRISQELHDQVGQELTATLLLLSRLGSRAPEELRPTVSEVQESVRANLEEVRRISIELRPEALDDLGLESALAVLCDRLAERSGMEVSCDISQELPSLGPEAELVVYRVAQEALTNAARHAHTGRVVLTLRTEDEQVLLKVRDSGVGLAADQAPGSGIRGMRERAALIGATLDLRDAQPGTEVALTVPLGNTAR
jgi:two-component system, NarL family, sensor histidine kinase UhpB